jgi:mRNA-degrading endonuclease RelE of RelBE toxin-antitoxin system
MKPKWAVNLSAPAVKMVKKMPEKVISLLTALIGDIEENDPIQKEWADFGSLAKSKRIPENVYHCHLKKGRPTYVVCWQVNKERKIVEVFYVGTHENAPYQK